MKNSQSQTRHFPIHSRFSWKKICFCLVCSLFVSGCSYSHPVEFYFEVRDAETDKPIEGAKITFYLFKDGTEGQFTVTTDQNGTATRATEISEVYFESWETWAIEHVKAGYATKRIQLTPRVKTNASQKKSPSKKVAKIITCVSLSKTKA